MRPQNTGSPDPERLRAAVSLVVSKLKPDQVILFGSAARNEMHAGSDLDLLAITAPGTPTEHPRHKRWQCGETENDEVDVLVMPRDEVEQGRHSITLVQGAALDEGRTVYARPGVRPVRTGPEYVWNGREMVKKTLFDPDEATRLLDRAETRWRYANEDYSGPIDSCQQLQQCMEFALKAIKIAQGERVKHKHNLNELWDDIEQRGEVIRAVRDRKAVDILSLYGSQLRYDAPTAETDPSITWADTKVTGEDLLNHARARVPKLIEDTRRRLRTPADAP